MSDVDPKGDAFHRVAWTIADLVSEKNAAYGDSFYRVGRMMRELYPNGITPEQMDDALAIVRCLDKFCRIATRKNAYGENPWRDVTGYGLLSVEADERRAAEHAGGNEAASDARKSDPTTPQEIPGFLAEFANATLERKDRAWMRRMREAAKAHVRATDPDGVVSVMDVLRRLAAIDPDAHLWADVRDIQRDAARGMAVWSAQAQVELP